MPAVTSPDDTSPLSTRRRRLLFRAQHRGTKECDIMLGGFVARHIHALDEPTLAELEALLELPDVDLADWLSGRRPVPPDVASALFARIVAEVAGGPR
jgi:antitoxin CptB